MIFALEVIIGILIVELICVIVLSVAFYFAISKDEDEYGIPDLYRMGHIIYDSFCADLSYLSSKLNNPDLVSYLNTNKLEILLAHPYSVYIMNCYILEHYSDDSAEYKSKMEYIIENILDDEIIQKVAKEDKWKIAINREEFATDAKAVYIYITSNINRLKLDNAIYTITNNSTMKEDADKWIKQVIK